MHLYQPPITPPTINSASVVLYPLFVRSRHPVFTVTPRLTLFSPSLHSVLSLTVCTLTAQRSQYNETREALASKRF